MMNLFREKLEQGVAEMYGTSEPIEEKKKDMKVHEVNKKEATGYLGLI